MIKKLVLLLVLFFSYNNVSALELCSPSQDYIDYMNIPEEERVNYQEPIYCSSVFDRKLSSPSSATGSINSITLGGQESISSSFYSAYNEGIVNASGNQRLTGLCWDFSALSVVETNAMKNQAGKYNFSEVHLAYSILGNVYADSSEQKNKYSYDARDGGKITFASSYFFNNYGQLLENELPFDSNLNYETTNLKKINASSYINGNSYVTVSTFKIDNINSNSVCSIDEINTIKSYILKYGSVQATMYMDSSNFAGNGRKYYLSNNANENHGVVIVGWDDSISKDLFGATRDGAFIVKNSWGSTWGDDNNGIFYISYDDYSICKAIVSYSGVSNKTFDNSYRASDLVGNMVLGFPKTSYIASKFTKESSGIETIDRVSFATAPYTTYSVYLARNNVLDDKDNWELLRTGSSDAFGIDSINLDSIEVSDNFTIIVKYDFPIDSFSIFTMCDNNLDYNAPDISTNTNYFSIDGNIWEDMSNIVRSSATYRCEPNVYVYTNNKNNTPKLEINAITNIDDNINLAITKKNISNNNVSYKILDSNGKDVTSHFTITPDYDSASVDIVTDNTVSGDFSILISGNGVNSSSSFSLIEDIKSNSNNLVIDNDKVVVTIGKGKTLTYKDVYDSLKLKNTGIKITDSKGKTVTSDTAPVGTKNKLSTNSNGYDIVVKGDPTGDGKLSALDYIMLRKHIMKIETIIDPIIKAAADMDNNDKISALDYIAIRKIMIGE